jgi:hypothetical protein
MLTYLFLRGLIVGWLEAVPSSKTYRLANPRDPARKEKKTYLTAKKKQALLQKKRAVALKPDLEENPYAHPLQSPRKKEHQVFDFVEQDAMLARAELLAKRAIKIPPPRKSDIEAGRSSPPPRRQLNARGTFGRGRPPKAESKALTNPDVQAAAAASLAMIADLALWDFELKSDASASEPGNREPNSSSSGIAMSPQTLPSASSSAETSPANMPSTPSIKNESADESSVAPAPLPLVHDDDDDLVLQKDDDDDDSDADKMDVDSEGAAEQAKLERRSTRAHRMQTRFSRTTTKGPDPAPPAPERISSRLLAKQRGEIEPNILQRGEEMLAIAEGKPLPSKKRKRSQQSSEEDQPEAELVVVLEKPPPAEIPVEDNELKAPAPKRQKKVAPPAKKAAPPAKKAAAAKKSAAAKKRGRVPARKGKGAKKVGRK